MRLEQQLAAFKTEFARTAPAGRPALYEAKIDELRASFVMEAAIGVGDQAPTFTLPDAHGKKLSLSDLLQSGPTVVTFYRGGWCPYCNLQLRAYQAALPEMTALGARLVAISPELPDRSATQSRGALASSSRCPRNCGRRFARITKPCRASTATKAGSCRSQRLTSSAKTAVWRSPPSTSITEIAPNRKPSWTR
jgi:hypothetical protein